MESVSREKRHLEVASLLDWPAVMNRDESHPGQPPSKEPVAQNAQVTRE